ALPWRRRPGQPFKRCNVDQPRATSRPARAVLVRVARLTVHPVLGDVRSCMIALGHDRALFRTGATAVFIATEPALHLPSPPRGRRATRDTTSLAGGEGHRPALPQPA